MYQVDGALCDATIRKWRTLHDLWYLEAGGVEYATSEGPDLRSSELVIGMKCEVPSPTRRNTVVAGLELGSLGGFSIWDSGLGV